MLTPEWSDESVDLWGPDDQKNGLLKSWMPARHHVQGYKRPEQSQKNLLKIDIP
jgi:hypothetical protein